MAEPQFAQVDQGKTQLARGLLKAAQGGDVNVDKLLESYLDSSGNIDPAKLSALADAFVNGINEMIPDPLKETTNAKGEKVLTADRKGLETAAANELKDLITSKATDPQALVAAMAQFSKTDPNDPTRGIGIVDWINIMRENEAGLLSYLPPGYEASALSAAIGGEMGGILGGLVGGRGSQSDLNQETQAALANTFHIIKSGGDGLDIAEKVWGIEYDDAERKKILEDKTSNYFRHPAGDSGYTKHFFDGTNAPGSSGPKYGEEFILVRGASAAKGGAILNSQGFGDVFLKGLEENPAVDLEFNDAEYAAFVASRPAGEAWPPTAREALSQIAENALNGGDIQASHANAMVAKMQSDGLLSRSLDPGAAAALANMLDNLDTGDLKRPWMAAEVLHAQIETYNALNTPIIDFMPEARQILRVNLVII